MNYGIDEYPMANGHGEPNHVAFETSSVKTSFILDSFSEKLPLKIDIAFAKKIRKFIEIFETTDPAPQALNSACVGVDKVVFTSNHTTEVFNIFNHKQRDVELVIKDIPSIDKNFKVVSDPLNLILLWGIHNTMKAKLTEKMKRQLASDLFKIMHYRFFTSVVSNSFRYPANEEIMRYVVEKKINKKFDISKYGTWKKVIEVRCNDLISKGDLHFNMINKFNDDEKVLYIISDTQTRIRSKILSISQIYYELHSEGSRDLRIESVSATDTIEGEKILRNKSGVMDNMINNLTAKVLQKRDFISYGLAKDVAKQSTGLRTDKFITILRKMNEQAVVDKNSEQFYSVGISKECGEYPKGMGMLIKELIQVVYKQCIIADVNMSSKKAILIKAINLFISSRIADKEVIRVKYGLTEFILSCKVTTREATITSLRTALVTYIVVKSFDYI